MTNVRQQFWVCDNCHFRRLSELIAIAHVEQTDHTVRRGKAYIRPRRPSQMRRLRYEPEETTWVNGKGLAVILAITVVLMSSPFWLPWAQAKFLSGPQPRPVPTPTACVPFVVSFVQVFGPEYPNATLNGSAYRRSGSEGGVEDKRALQQACTITNFRGEQVPALVQVKGVVMRYYEAATYDCAAAFAKVNGGGPYPDGNVYCDYVGNIWEGVYEGNRSKGFIHIEIDHDWQAAGFCGPGTPCDNLRLGLYRSNSTRTVLLDMTGYVYWDEDGWFELHPLTAWSLAA